MNFLVRYKHSGLLLLVLGFVIGYGAEHAGLDGARNAFKNSLIPIEEKGTSYSFIPT